MRAPVYTLTPIFDRMKMATLNSTNITLQDTNKNKLKIMYTINNICIFILY